MALRRASGRDTAAFSADVVAPLLARGVIERRARVENALDRLDADRRAVRRMQLLRYRYGEEPLLLGVPGRQIAIVLSPAHVKRVLAAAPEPFSPANREKRAALSHFQPHGVLISTGAERAERRAFNERVLDTGAAVHRELGAQMAAKVGEEASALLDAARRAGSLRWEAFAQAWWRAVRRVTFGDAAREDVDVIEELSRLRRDANWAYFKPVRKRLRGEFLARVRAYLGRAEPGSLASLAAAEHGTFPEEQFAHWLFAFDAAGMASFRALALLDAYSEQAGADPSFLRACVLESVRLWPTTPAILRDAADPVSFDAGSVPAGAAVVVFAPFFHRDGERFPYADSFAPGLWTGGRSDDDWQLIPFSRGPAECPGRDVVLHMTSSFLAKLVEVRPPRQIHARRLHAGRPLPATLSPFRLTFEIPEPG
jgi:cytochrome P450